MELHLPTLLLACAAMMGLSAAVLGLTGLTQRVYRGHPWWVAATWGATLGVALESLRDAAPGVSLVAHLLLLQWPIVVLTGLRRFDARLPLPFKPALDAGLLGLAAVAVLVLDIRNGGAGDAATAYALAAGLLHLYVAVVLLSVAPQPRVPALRLVGALFMLLGVVLLARTWLPLDTQAAQAVRQHALTHALACVAFAFLALHATYERTEKDLRESRRKLKVLANLDMLTQVPNRRHFQELARRALDRDPPGSAAVVMFDIDHFKQINDNWGHAVGDRALRLLSRCLQEVLRQHDVSGRRGGDEFALLLPRTQAQDAMLVAQRIVSRVQHLAQGQQMPAISLSFGVVQMRGEDDVDAALRRADQALYEAKRQGRGCAVLAEGDEDEPVYSESRPLGLTPN
ncbi:diguanylate cyclase (GGDEF) domain-containing protein [Burkholderiales bacterium JOSHI_001]|nr:diguanylate cyclase (GGDEF) domain-containing protein [Burkholderiales bacterium JOSHI_001]